MSKKKPTEQKPKAPPRPTLWVYFVSYTVAAPGGNYDSRSEVKFEKAIRSIEDIGQIENIIKQRYTSRYAVVRDIIVRSYQFLRNEPIPQASVKDVVKGAGLEALEEGTEKE